MTESQYISKIEQLEKEIDYLHGLLDAAGIPYRRAARDIDELSPSQNILFEENQGARIIPATITKQYVKFFYSMFKGCSDVYSLRYGKPNKKTGKHGYYTQCNNICSYPGLYA